jgi:MFS transporter, putative metabolite:H+ symporter
MPLSPTTASPAAKPNAGVYTAIIVAALGYMVDIYDLILFSMVRKASLTTLGFSGADLTYHGEVLLNIQMAGLFIGGILWGVWGDKKGRLSVLFGSILMYSLANIANGFVQNIETYATMRFIAGIGLAGELGAGITLVSELMSKHNRGYGTTIVASFGAVGAVIAAIVVKYDWGITWQGELLANWRIAYFIGGVMGLTLLVLRLGVFESGMFSELKSQEVRRGDISMLFFRRANLKKYFNCILIGLPLWFIIGILVTQSSEFARAQGIPEKTIDDPTAIMFAYIGLILGDTASGLVSQWLKSRRKAIFWFLVLCCATNVYYFSMGQVDAAHFYGVSLALGFAVGYWAVFVTVASEQFGTNLRATVTTTVPNFVRGAVIPITLAFQFLKQHVFDQSPHPNLPSALVLSVICLLIAFYSLYHLTETYGKDLDYLEH